MRLIFYWIKEIRRPRTLYIIRGVSGHGKSSSAEVITPWNVAADDMPGLYNKDGTYNLHLQSRSHHWCQEQVTRWMQQGKRRVAVHNTFVKTKYMESYLALARQYGYSVQILHAEAVRLPDGSIPKNIHGVSDEILERQRQGWELFNQVKSDVNIYG